MNIVAIPVKDKLEWTAPLVEHLLLHDEIDELWIYDNGSRDRTPDWIANRKRIDGRLHRIEAPQAGLYDMWNTMIKTASTRDEKTNLAILNNDIRLPPNAIRDMSKLMREGEYQIAAVDPSRTGLYSYSIGWWSPDRALPEPIEPYCENQGLGFRIGWAFVLAAEFWKDEEYAIHPDLKIYYGDDDLYRRAMERGGRACVVRGIGSDHAENQSGWERNPEIWEKDKKLYQSLWVERPSPTETVHIVTAISRPENVQHICQSLIVATAPVKNLKFVWHWRFDVERNGIAYAHQIKNEMIEDVDDNDWIWILDDDTVVHPELFLEFEKVVSEELEAFVVCQDRLDGRKLIAAPENCRVDHIDSNQAVFRKRIVGDARMTEIYAGDGVFLEAILSGRENVLFSDKFLCYHNMLVMPEEGFEPTHLEGTPS